MHARFLRLALVPCLLWASAVCAFAQSGRLVAAEKGLSLRTKADTAAERVQMLAPFERVELLEVKGEWARVKASSSGKSGWVLASYLSKTAFVTAAADKLPVRIGPGEKHDVKFEVGRNYPFLVVDRTEGWLKVQDFEGDVGWVAQSLVSVKPYVITRLEKCNVRKGPAESHEVAFTAERSVILEVVGERDGWINVKHSDGDTGWMSAKIVFGWLDIPPTK